MNDVEHLQSTIRIPWFLWVGSTLWLLLVFSIAWFAFWPNLDGKGLKPNEFGDLLAGAFSPLAFAWFVYAVLMQREELELQRKELSATRTVLKDQKNAQTLSASESKRLSDLTETQIRIDNEGRRLILHEKLIEIFSERLRLRGGIVGKIHSFESLPKNNYALIIKISDYCNLNENDFDSIAKSLRGLEDVSASELESIITVSNAIIEIGLQNERIKSLNEELRISKIAEYAARLFIELKKR